MTKLRQRLDLVATLCVISLAIPLRASTQERPRSYRDAAQQPAQPSPPTVQPGAPNVLFSSDEDYRIGCTDVLQITVQDAPELSNTVRVSAAGVIPVGFLGQIKAAGKTPEELQNMIADGLRGEYLTNPQVTVVVTQYNSRSLFIQGAVKNPGVYIIEGRPSLLKLITMAGGLAENHGSTAFIIREIKSPKSDQTGRTRVIKTTADTPASGGGASVHAAAAVTNQAMAQGGQSVVASGQTATAVSQTPVDPANQIAPTDEEDGRYEMKQVNINSLLKGNFSQNLVIQPGDIINIPNTDVFFVAGEVRSPGSYPLKEGTTLRQAVTLAQGVTFRAKPNMGIIFREDPRTAKRQEIKVDIGDVMAGKKDDVPILANDIIIVPNSRLKSVTQTLLSAFGTSATRVPIP